ncbi:MAG: tetratricopeptide repeat protein [Planctomycetes bacterium]|nr:tetratricopeptide repeat protein [Planctomycetota bacterium]
MNRDDFLDQLREKAFDASDNGQYAYVVEALPAYLEHEPDDGWAWILYGRALEELGRLNEAALALLCADRVAPDDAMGHVYVGLGDVCRGQGKYERAETWYARAAETEYGREYACVWVFRGSNLADLEAFELAEHCYRRATTLRGDAMDEAHTNLGSAFLSQGQWAEAAEAFQSALAINEDYSPARKGLKWLEDIREAIRLANSVGL